MRELTEGLSKLRNKKAVALIRVCNENLKRAVFLVLRWTALFNECLHSWPSGKVSIVTPKRESNSLTHHGRK